MILATYKNIYQHTSILILTIFIIIKRNETKRKITFNDFVLRHAKKLHYFHYNILTGKMALCKNVLILIIRNISVYSVKQCINSDVKILTVNVLLISKSMYTNNFGYKLAQKPGRNLFLPAPV